MCNPEVVRHKSHPNEIRSLWLYRLFAIDKIGLLGRSVGSRTESASHFNDSSARRPVGYIAHWLFHNPNTISYNRS